MNEEDYLPEENVPHRLLSDMSSTDMDADVAAQDHPENTFRMLDGKPHPLSTLPHLQMLG